MRSLVRIQLFALTMCTALSAGAQQPAARLDDATSGGGKVVTGTPKVLINGRPAARVGDQVVTPRVQPPGVPCVGGPILTGSSTVFIAGARAARVGDLAQTACGPEGIVSGSVNVVLGN
jgi:uncharacterized Zn-binding protein involved in type VI secretion